MKQLLVLFTLFCLGASHSWLHCVDYDKSAPLNASSIENSKCSAFPRDMSAADIFGVDRGINYQPTDDKPCRSPTGSIVNYMKGETYRLLWPAKNHQADACTNPYIPDNQLKVFFYPVAEAAADPNLVEWTQEKYLVQDFKKNGRGFQNCPDFCSNPDKAPCFGDLKIPDSLDGRYKVLWYWEFNKGQFYTHCYDVEIVSTKPSPIPQTSQPGCSRLYGQCGGRTWSGSTCCAEGACIVSNIEYSQCLPLRPTSQIPTLKPTSQIPTLKPTSTPETWKLCRCKCP